MIRFLLAKFWLLCASLVILFAVTLTVARLALPHVDRHHDRIEGWLSDAVGQRIVIGALAAEWHGLGPRLLLSEVSLLGEDGMPIAQFSAAAVDFDLFASMLDRAPRIDRLLLRGIDLTVERDAGGGFALAGQGFATGGADGAGRDRLLRWMLDQGRLAIEGAAITWIDPALADGLPQYFTGVDIELRNAPGRHQVDVSAELPAALGATADARLDIIGDPLTADWRGRLYLRGDRIVLGRWLEGRTPGGVRVEQGTADFTLWAELRERRVERIDGRASAARITLLAADPGETAGEEPPLPRVPQVVDAVAADFAWRTIAGGWRVDIDRLVFTGDGIAGAPGRVAVEWRDAGADGPGVAARAEHVPIGELARLLLPAGALDERARRALLNIDPAGQVEALDLRYRRDGEQHRYAVRADIAGLRTSPWSGVPGVSNFSGMLALDHDGGGFDLDTADARLDFAGLFREPLPIAAAQGRIAWRRHEGGWRIQIPRLDLRNEDATLTAWGRLDLPPEGEVPSIALFAHFDADTVERTSRYLPVRIMPPATVAWLDRSILGGASPRGDHVFHGPLRGFPFDGGSGRFKVDFDLVGGSLDYSPGWPPIDGIDARIVFEGRRMDIAAVAGSSLASRVLRADVAIADLTGKPAVLTVDGRAEGSTADALRYLRETPLAERFGAIAGDADATGESRLSLALRIPLDGSPAEVDGEIDFRDSTLVLADETIDIRRINGRLRFTDSGVSAERIDAEILGLPARVTVSPRLEDGSAGALVEAVGNADGDAIAGLLDIAPLRHLEGRAAWRARLRVPFGERHDGPGVRLTIASDLRGLAIRLPAPLDKPAEIAMPLTISIPLPREPDMPVRFRLGDTLAGVLTLDAAAGIERGELRLGGGAPALPAQPGLRIAGETAEIAYEPWVAVFAGDEERAGAAHGIVNAIDLRAGRIYLYGREFNAVHLDARRDAVAWTARVSSDQIAGNIVIPLEEGRTWRADLTHLHLAAAVEDGPAARVADPRELPPLRVESERFTYGGTDFGRLSLVSTRRPAGMHMDRLTLASAKTRIGARGDWVVAGDQQFSSFNIDFETDDFGAALAGFGYADTIRGGKGTAKVIARWRGPPTAFALERLDGSMDMTISNGRLLDVEPGAGRIFGLISLQALPRRLTLDFSDFFGRGFSFDRISGSFAIRDGVATTGDLEMNGPAARVEAAGAINLAAREYDQIVTVHPNVSSGLPVAGLVAGGVGLGAAILLMERVFKSDIDRMTRITYQVRGPWSNPEVRRLQDGAQSGKR